MVFDLIPLYLGKEQIQALQANNTIYIFFLMGSLVIMAIYHFGLFFLRKEDIAALVFGIFVFSFHSFILFIGDVWITSIYPNLDWNWMYRFEYLSLYFSACQHLHYLLSLCLEEFNKIVLYLTLPIYSLLSALVLFFKKCFHSV